MVVISAFGYLLASASSHREHARDQFPKCVSFRGQLSKSPGARLQAGSAACIRDPSWFHVLLRAPYFETNLHVYLQRSNLGGFQMLELTVNYLRVANSAMIGTSPGMSLEIRAPGDCQELGGVIHGSWPGGDV